MRIAPLFVFVVLLAGCTTDPENKTPGQGTKETTVVAPVAPLPDPLPDLNAAFRSVYAAARERHLDLERPFLVAGFSEVVLFTKSGETRRPDTPALYHNLKMVAHAVLSAYCLLEGEVRAEETKGYLAKLKRAEEGLEGVDFGPGGLERQKKILQRTREVLEMALAGKADEREREAYYQEMVPLFAANIKAAARAQLDLLNASVTELVEGMSVADFGRLQVVVTGAHQAREKYLKSVYFRALFDETGPWEDRVIFCELLFADGPTEIEKARTLLGTHMLDAAASEAFYGDRFRLQEDVLGKDAEEYVKTLKLPKKK